MHSLAVNSICWLYSLSPFVGTKGSREDRRERERKREREGEKKERTKKKEQLRRSSSEFQNASPAGGVIKS